MAGRIVEKISLVLTGVRWTSAQASSCLYQILEVSQTATPAEIKAAFREKAKILHPDAPLNSKIKHSRRYAEWIKVLGAYEVLADCRARAVYDLSISGQSSSQMLRNAATDGMQKGLRRGEHVNINLSWGLDSILSRESLRDSSAVDKLRDGLQNDFYAALRQAYFGPALPLDDEVEGGRLPKFFEADERSVMENPEVIQLVFGREVLGCVRERKPRRLPSRTPGAPRFPRMRMNPQESIQDSKKDSLAKAPLHTNDTMRKNKQSTVTMNSSVNEVEDDLVLDFIMGGESLATAVRFAQSPRMQMERDVKESSGVVFHRASFYKNEALVALLVEDVDEDVDAAATARRCVKLVTPEGRHTHTVLRSTTPLVRHLDFLNAGGNICVAQARRAWLPPSNLWLFKPRSYAHDTGGWSIEWAGHARQRHPAWLDPHVMVLMVALHTIEHELGGRQPQGVFGREGGTLGWLWSMLHFH